MDIEQALHQLGAIPDLFTPAQRDSLDTLGYVILPNLFTPEQCRRAGEEFDRMSAIEGEQGGHEVHTEAGAPRVSNIFNKSTAFDCCLHCKSLLASAHYLLGDFKVHGANLREPAPGRGEQNLHTDVGRRFPGDWQVLNALILFDDMTPDNGATRVVPGSHRWPLLPGPGRPIPESLTAEEAALLPAEYKAPYPGELVVTAPAGSVVAINSVLWHAGTRNVSGARRRQLHLSFTRRDLPQQLNQRLHLTPQLDARLTPALRYLLDVEPISPQA
jgi:ectoine hydroxylase-related dioxygenase (phytanoyl-CoA dioxygenase family)